MQQKNAVDEQDGVGGSLLLVDEKGGIGAKIEDNVLIAPAPLRSKWGEQHPLHSYVIKAIFT